MSQGPEDGGTPVPSTEHEAPPVPAVDSTVKPEEWTAMLDILNTVYAYRKDGDHDPSKVFHRKVNKRVLPSYYEVIKEPIALSTIKAKINTKAYDDFAQFVRDFTLIFHNAQVYNRPEAPAYQDALDIKALFEQELKKLVDNKTISADEAKLPYMGEIPPPDELLSMTANEQEEEDDDDDDDDEEGEESDDSRGNKKRGRGRPRGSVTAAKKVETPNSKEEAQRVAEIEARKKRGRPPKVDTPMEARMKNILKAMRKFKSADGLQKIASFERLPDKAVMPEYFNEIKKPMAVDVLKKKLKRKKYQTVAQFLSDVDQMFENAKLYNEDESQIYKDAVELQIEVHKAAEEEMKKPDTDYMMEDGRLPLPNGILHNGELYRVGDWVHIQNPNDLTKPIVTQIYRTWQDAAGQKWVNACWYYRPEQTVHRFDRHFFENEVVKTGQYRDHQVEEIVDRCFVMFITRYNKGRPRNFPSEKEIYVCEARYNEEKFTLNKIKTWASCLPDEVRDKDYEMDMYQDTKKMKKFPSPIAYLLKDDAKETDDLPKPEWGADNAPPKIGAVHKRPRDPKDSPPPEPTPTPPPPEPTPPPPPPPRQNSNIIMNNQASMPARLDSQANMHSITQRQPSVSSAVPKPNHNIPQHRPSMSSATPAPLTRQISDQRLNTASAHAPQANTNSRHTPLAPASIAPAARYAPAMPQYSTNYKAPQPVEVWHLNDAANASIPPDIREQFERDEYGRVLFFTAPPLDMAGGVSSVARLGHSARYLAAKLKREEARAQKSNPSSNPNGLQKQQDDDELNLAATEPDLSKTMHSWEEQSIAGTRAAFKELYGDDWERRMVEELDRIAEAQRVNVRHEEMVAEHARQRSLKREARGV